MIDITEHMGLAKTVALKVYKRFYKRYELEDLVQQAYVGLALAAKKFDVSKGFQFSTYAWSNIYFHLTRYVRDDRYYPAKDKYDRLSEMETIASLNYEIDSVENSSEIIEFLTCRDEDLPDSEIAELRIAMSELSQEEREVIQRLYFSGKKKYEIAEEMGTYPTKISRLTQTALAHLKEALTA